MKEKLGRYKKNCKEILLLQKQIDRLKESMKSIEEVAGKVTKSSDDFPYIEQHVTVKMSNPQKTQAIQKRIDKKDKRRIQLVKENLEVHKFIESLPDGLEKEIMELSYIDGMNQNEVAEMLGYTKGRISQIVAGIMSKLN